jgi:transcriptional regulator with XRE-family HTH domain
MSTRRTRRSTAVLFALIAAKGWSMSEAARQLGVPRTTLVNIRDGRQGLGIATMETIEENLPGYSRDLLFPMAVSGATDKAS